MRVGQVILRVNDLDESVAFWTATVGLTVTTQSGSFAFLDGGSIQLTLNEVHSPLADESLTEVVFEFEDVRAAHAELVKRGVPFEVDLRPVTSDGDRRLLAAHFRDPDGHLASVVGWVS
jgi:catechol 2,3-dioxygenase-like lactoylglutathione lyase family enzyme